jgi:DNA-binding NtrC family response regulator
VASILIVGSDAALLEGVAQTLVGAGHHAAVAKDIPEALETLHGKRPLIALVHCEELISRGQMLHAALVHGGALLAFHCDDDDRYTLPFNIKRTTLATLRLPLERQRLLALVRYIENRALAAGRESADGDDIAAENRDQM